MWPGPCEAGTGHGRHLVQCLLLPHAACQGPPCCASTPTCSTYTPALTAAHPPHALQDQLEGAKVLKEMNGKYVGELIYT